MLDKLDEDLKNISGQCEKLLADLNFALGMKQVVVNMIEHIKNPPAEAAPMPVPAAPEIPVEPVVSPPETVN